MWIWSHFLKIFYYGVFTLLLWYYEMIQCLCAETNKVLRMTHNLILTKLFAWFLCISTTLDSMGQNWNYIIHTCPSTDSTYVISDWLPQYCCLKTRQNHNLLVTCNINPYLAYRSPVLLLETCCPETFYLGNRLCFFCTRVSAFANTISATSVWPLNIYWVHL